MWLRLAPARLVRTLRDWQWWLALAAGPVFWALLASLGNSVGDIRWPLAQPITYMRLALLMPILEELVFRGALQGWLLQQLWGAHARVGLSNANLLTSALFSAAHFFYHAPLWALSVFLPSLVFGYFRERHASVLPAILLHVAYNAGYFWLFFRPAA